MDSPGGTIGELLARARARLKDAGIEEFKLEGELLVQHFLQIDAARMFAGTADDVDPARVAELLAAVERRTTREPLAYITGRRGFYGREFTVTLAVLIPRQETELLVDLALKWVAERPDRASTLRVADIGVGSGALAVTLAAEIPPATVDAVDLSQAAIEIARINAEAYDVSERVHFMVGDLGVPLAGRRYQVVVANLPYVRSDTLADAEPEVRREPELALLGGEDGLDVVRRLAKQLPDLMDRSGSLALFEIDPLTAAGAAELIRTALPDAHIEVVDDYAGLERCVRVEIG